MFHCLCMKISCCIFLCEEWSRELYTYTYIPGEPEKVPTFENSLHQRYFTDLKVLNFG